jgi:hypothetical protein
MQEIPNDYFDRKIKYFQHSIGKNWESNSTLGPLRYQDLDNFIINDSLIKNKIIFGLKSVNNDILISADSNLRFKKYFYLFYKLNSTNNAESFTSFSGNPRKKRRFNYLNSIEVDYSGIGFENHFALLQFGRGRQSWGAGSKSLLILNALSPVYEYGLLGFKLGNIKMKYFHGFLESINRSEGNFNRYIYGKGLEWSNGKNLLISFSEVGVYQGLDRPMDLSFLNPLSNHIEIELNSRQNKQGNNQNAIWQLSLDKYAYQKIRLSFNFLIDELTLDNEGNEIGESHLLALSGSMNYLIKNSEEFYYLINSSLNLIGTHTYRHQYGLNNFVSKGNVLGSEFGSDISTFELGLKMIKNDNSFIFDINYKNNLSGSNNILLNPYGPNEDTFRESFPSGRAEKTESFNLKFEIWSNETFGFSTKLIRQRKNNNYENSILIEFFYFNSINSNFISSLF